VFTHNITIGYVSLCHILYVLVFSAASNALSFKSSMLVIAALTQYNLFMDVILISLLQHILTDVFCGLTISHNSVVCFLLI